MSWGIISVMREMKTSGSFQTTACL